jgi:hypothetical protein
MFVRGGTDGFRFQRQQLQKVVPDKFVTKVVRDRIN